MLHYDNNSFSDIQLLSNAINDECTKVYACMLSRVIWEECVGLYRMNDLR